MTAMPAKINALWTCQQHGTSARGIMISIMIVGIYEFMNGSMHNEVLKQVVITQQACPTCMYTKIDLSTQCYYVLTP